MMKAFSVASILALAIAGTACSQTKEAEAEDTSVETKSPETIEAADDVGGSFNLGFPTDAGAAPATGGSFNLGLPTSTATSTDGFNLGIEISASNGLGELPAIEAPVSQEITPETDEDDEPIIRLE